MWPPTVLCAGVTMPAAAQRLRVLLSTPIALAAALVLTRFGGVFMTTLSQFDTQITTYTLNATFAQFAPMRLR